MCCSLKWLSGILSECPTQLEIQNLNVQILSKLLLEPYQDGVLKSEVVLSLTHPSLYLSAYGVLIPGDQVEDNSSFEPLIHSLARKGVYVLEEDTTIVSSSMLAQDMPFREVRSDFTV